MLIYWAIITNLVSGIKTRIKYLIKLTSQEKNQKK